MIIVWPIQVGQQEDVCAVLSSDKNITTFVWHATGGGEGVSKEICGTVRLPVRRHVSSVTFKMASKVFIEETDKNFDFVTEILFRFLGFGDFKVSIVIEN